MENRLRRILKGTEEKRFLKSLNLEGKVVYDIGAWTGKGTTLLFSRLVGESGLVYAFEPCDVNFRKLIKNTRNKGNIISYNQGLGDKVEERTLIVPSRKQGRASMNKNIQQSFLRNGESCKLTHVLICTLDALIREDNLQPPDLVKIDTEGMELKILKGMINTIRMWKPQLLIELHGIGKESKIVNANNIITFLLSKNYNLYHVEARKKIINTFSVYENHIFASVEEETKI